MSTNVLMSFFLNVKRVKLLERMQICQTTRRARVELHEHKANQAPRFFSQVAARVVRHNCFSLVSKIGVESKCIRIFINMNC